MTRRRIYAVAAVAFVVLEITLGVLLQTLSGRAVAATSFGAVLLACLFCTLFAERSRAYLLTQLALICTVCADYFLVWSEPQARLPAMLFFSVTQLAYATRLYFSEERRRMRRGFLIARSILSAVALLVTWLVLRERCDALALVSLFYYANLVVNLPAAFVQRKEQLMAWGLLLFLLCDTVIGLSLVGEYLPVAEDALLYRILSPGFNLAWSFYLPSQLLLGLSLFPARWRRQEKTK